MLLGILSDTHGRWQRAGVAVRLMQNLGVNEFIHCGDVGGMEVFEQFAGLSLHFVAGNCDEFGPRDFVAIAALGFTLPRRVPLALEFAGRSVHVLHGHESAFAHFEPRHHSRPSAELPASAPDYLLHGHTHVARDERRGRTRIINPGALYRADVFSVATLDPAADLLQFWRLDESPALPALTPWQPL